MQIFEKGFRFRLGLPRAKRRHRPAAFLVILLGSILVLGCAPEEAANVDHVARAKDYQEQGDFKAAVIELKSALQQDGANVEARWLLGKLYLLGNNNSAAIKELQRARELGLSEEAVMVPLSRAWIRQKDYKELLANVSIAESMPAKQRASLHALRGQALVGLGQIEAGKGEYFKALELDSQQVEAILGLVLIDMSLGKLDAAGVGLERVAQIAPDNPDYLVTAGEYEQRQGRYHNAQGYYQKALKVLPNSVGARLGIASSAAAQGDIATAQEQLAQVQARQPKHPGALYLDAWIAYKSGSYRSAQESLETLLRVRPDHLQALFLSSVTLYALGEYERALKSITRFLVKVPGYSPAVKLKSAALLKLDSGEKALNVLDAMLVELPNDRDLLAMAAQAALSVGEGGDRKYLDLLLMAGEESGAGVRDEVRAALEKGDTEAAVKLLGARGEAQAEMRTALASIRQQIDRHDYQGALPLALALAERFPAVPEPLNLVGSAYYGMGDIPKARKAFLAALQLRAGNLPAILNLAGLDVLEGRFDDARLRYQAILSIDKKMLPALLGMARIAERQGDRAAAVDWLEQADAVAGGQLTVTVRLARAYLLAGQAEKAEAYLTAARQRAPDNLGLLEALAIAQMAAGKQQAALKSYLSLTRALPESAEMLVGLGGVQASLGQRDDAEKSLRHAVELAPADVMAAAALAEFYLGAGEADQATAVARDFQQRYPNSPSGFELEAIAAGRQGHYQQAADAFARAYAARPGAALSRKRYRSLVAAGKIDAALAALSEWTRANPADRTARMFLAQEYIAHGRAEAAIAEYNSMLDINENDAAVLNNLAEQLYLRGDTLAAEKRARTAYRLRPDSGATQDTLGWILVRSGRAAEALPLLRSAARLLPDSPEVHYHLGVGLLEADRLTAARKALSKALEGDATFPGVEDARQRLEQIQENRQRGSAGSTVSRP